MMMAKNMIPSPLGCCIPAGNRQDLNPVFKQQYVTEGGHIKMKVPISPMHYITNANFYARDERFPVRLEASYPVFNERLHHNTRNMDYDFNPDMGKRLLTPKVSFVSHPRRNLSAQVIDHSRSAPYGFDEVLRGINEKLSRIEFICKNNEDEIRDIIQMLKPKGEVNVEVRSGETRLVAKGENEGSGNKCLDPRNISHPGAPMGGEGRETGAQVGPFKYDPVNVAFAAQEPSLAELLPFQQVLRDSQDGIPKGDDKMFDVSEDLKRSNDMLEKYIRGFKLDDMGTLENRLDVLSADYAAQSVSNGVCEADPGADVAQEASIMASIESKFKRLFGRSDSKSSTTSSKGGKESLAVFEGLKEPLEKGDSRLDPNGDGNRGPKRMDRDAKISAPEPIITEKGTMEIQVGSGNELKLASSEVEIKKNEIKLADGEVKLRLTDAEMLSLLKGIDLPGKLRDANLTVDEMVFLKSLQNRDSWDSKRETMSDGSESGNEDGFKCDFLAPTRLDFEPLVRDDSIQPLGSASLD